MLANERVAGDEHDSGPRGKAPRRIPVDLAELDRLSLQRAWSNRDLAEAIDVRPETISEIYREGSATPALFRKLREKFAEPEIAQVLERMAARLMGGTVA